MIIGFWKLENRCTLCQMPDSLTIKNSRVSKRSTQNAVESPERALLQPNTFRRVRNIIYGYIKRFLLDNRLDWMKDSMSTRVK